LKERVEIETTLRHRETTITEHLLVIKRLEIQRNEHEQVIDSLNDRVESMKDVKAQLGGAHQVNQEVHVEKDDIREQLNAAGDFMLDLEQKVHKANATSLELL